ncbi:MAG: hypothetical protein IH969_08715 [Candidatus Krumholzibacteriota bacterium]|nr:hypothetical protein [Candidatus Krumholzibacteriota bacterium]
MAGIDASRISVGETSDKNALHIITELQKLGDKAIVSIPGLAMICDCNPKTIARAVERGDLPSPANFPGLGRAFTVGSIFRHFEFQIEQRTNASDIVRKHSPTG